MHARLRRWHTPTRADIGAGRRDEDAPRPAGGGWGDEQPGRLLVVPRVRSHNTAPRQALPLEQAYAVVSQNRTQVFLQRRFQCSLPSCCPSSVSLQCVCSSHMAMSNRKKGASTMQSKHVVLVSLTVIVFLALAPVTLVRAHDASEPAATLVETVRQATEHFQD